MREGTLKILGITGPIGCGKSTVASITEELGALRVVDADGLVHELEGAGTALTAQIGAVFGSEVIAVDGSVDRMRLGAIVFGNPEALRALEGLVHPAVRRRIEEMIDAHVSAGEHGVVTVEAIRLMESPIEERADAIWLVTCHPSIQRSRLNDRRGYSSEEVERRIGAGPPFITDRPFTKIVNDGTIETLRQAVREAWDRL